MLEMTLAEFNEKVGSVDKILYDESKEEGIVEEVIEGEKVAYVKGIKLIDSEKEIADLSSSYNYSSSSFGTIFILPKKKILDLRGIDVSDKKYFKGMFCKNFDKAIIDLSNWDTSNAINMSGMFAHTYDRYANNVPLGPYEIKGLENFKVNSVEDLSEFMCGCRGFKGVVDISKWNLEHVKTLAGAFRFGQEGANGLSDYTPYKTYPQIFMEGFKVANTCTNFIYAFTPISFMDTVFDCYGIDFSGNEREYLCIHGSATQIGSNVIGGQPQVKKIRLPKKGCYSKKGGIFSQKIKYYAEKLSITQSIDVDCYEDLNASGYGLRSFGVNDNSQPKYFDKGLDNYFKGENIVTFRDGSIPIVCIADYASSSYSYSTFPAVYKDGEIILGNDYYKSALNEEKFKRYYWINGEPVDSLDSLKKNDMAAIYFHKIIKITFNAQYNCNGATTKIPWEYTYKTLAGERTSEKEYIEFPTEIPIEKILKEQNVTPFIKPNGEVYKIIKDSYQDWSITGRWGGDRTLTCNLPSLMLSVRIRKDNQWNYVTVVTPYEDKSWKDVAEELLMKAVNEGLLEKAQYSFEKITHSNSDFVVTDFDQLIEDTGLPGNRYNLSLTYSKKEIQYNNKTVTLINSSKLKDVIEEMEPGLKFEDLNLTLELTDGSILENPSADYILQGNEKITTIDGICFVKFLRKDLDAKTGEIIEEKVLKEISLEEKNSLIDILKEEKTFELPEYVTNVDDIRNIYINKKLVTDLNIDIHKNDAIDIVYNCKDPEGKCMVSFVEKIITPEGLNEKVLDGPEEVGEFNTLVEILVKESTFEFPSYIEDVSTIRKIYINGNEVTDLDTDIIKDDVIEIVYSYQNYHEEERECTVDKVIICAEQGECRFKFKIKDIDFDKVPWGQSIDCICDNGWGKFNINPWMHNGDGFQGYLGNPDGQGNCVMSIWAGEPWTMELSLKEGGEFGFEFEEIVNAKLLTVNKETVKVLN